MPKVLIIEDETTIRAVLKDILADQKELKLEIEEAKDGQEGLAKLQTDQFDIAFCDIKMPKMDGMEVLQKAKEKGITTAFIMISAHGTTELAVDAVKNGAYDFLQKSPAHHPAQCARPYLTDERNRIAKEKNFDQV